MVAFKNGGLFVRGSRVSRVWTLEIPPGLRENPQADHDWYDQIDPCQCGIVEAPGIHVSAIGSSRSTPMISIPIGSMYGIFTYIYHKNQLNTWMSRTGSEPDQW